MKIKQISIFLENTAGRIADVTGVLKSNGIDLRAAMIADTADFGILRIITSDPDKTLSVLNGAKFTTKITEVLAVRVSDKVGALHDVMELFQKNGINIEYLYASLDKIGDSAMLVFKVADVEKGLELIEKNNLSYK